MTDPGHVGSAGVAPPPFTYFALNAARHDRAAFFIAQARS